MRHAPLQTSQPSPNGSIKTLRNGAGCIESEAILISKSEAVVKLNVCIRDKTIGDIYVPETDIGIPDRLRFPSKLIHLTRKISRLLEGRLTHGQVIGKSYAPEKQSQETPLVSALQWNLIDLTLEANQELVLQVHEHVGGQLTARHPLRN